MWFSTFYKKKKYLSCIFFSFVLSSHLSILVVFIICMEVYGEYHQFECIVNECTQNTLQHNTTKMRIIPFLSCDIFSFLSFSLIRFIFVVILSHSLFDSACLESAIWTDGGGGGSKYEDIKGEKGFSYLEKCRLDTKRKKTPTTTTTTTKIALLRCCITKSVAVVVLMVVSSIYVCIYICFVAASRIYTCVKSE